MTECLFSSFAPLVHALTSVHSHTPLIHGFTNTGLAQSPALLAQPLLAGNVATLSEHVDSRDIAAGAVYPLVLGALAVHRIDEGSPVLDGRARAASRAR